MTNSLMLQHTPNGPLGSDTRDQLRSPLPSPVPPPAPVDKIPNGNATDASKAPTPIKIGKKKKPENSIVDENQWPDVAKAAAVAKEEKKEIKTVEDGDEQVSTSTFPSNPSGSINVSLTTKHRAACLRQ